LQRYIKFWSGFFLFDTGILIAIAFLTLFWTIISAENITEKLPTIFETKNESPWVDRCPPKLIRHETDCTKYYECIHGQKQLRSCSAGLYFNKRWRGCIKRQISDCLLISTTSMTVTIPTVTPDCIHGDLLKHECTCTQFYECQYDEKILHDCRSALRPSNKDLRTRNKLWKSPAPLYRRGTHASWVPMLEILRVQERLEGLAWVSKGVTFWQRDAVLRSWGELRQTIAAMCKWRYEKPL